MQYDFYPSFYQQCGKRTQTLIVCCYFILCLLPLYIEFDLGFLNELHFVLLIITPAISALLMVGLDILLHHHLAPRYFKPFRITAERLFIPGWLMYSNTQIKPSDLIIDTANIHSIIVRSYQLSGKHDPIPLLDNICIKTWQRDIYLEGKQLPKGLATQSELIQGLNILPDIIVTEHKTSFGDLRILFNTLQGRYGFVYTAIFLLMVIFSFGVMLGLFFRF